jgi:Restriction endonuclease
MGYETILSLGNENLFMWRKYANALPRLLFQHHEIHVEFLPDHKTIADRGPTIRVELRTTAREALATLDRAGLGWPATVAAYSETMIRRGFAAGMVMASATPLEEDGPTSIPQSPPSDLLDDFDQVSAETDLYAMGTLLAHQLFNKPVLDEEYDSQDHTILGQLTLDGTIESIFMTAHEAEIYARKWVLELDIFALVRAVESWCVLNRDAPLIAWPMLMAVILRAVDPDLPLIYDLSDDAWDVECVASIDEGLNYAYDYWKASSEGMASSARVIGKLFDVLSSFDGELSREFWFARASDALVKILVPTTSQSSVSTKSRGDLLEDLVEALVRTEMPELEVVERNLRMKGEEIDLVVSNGLNHPFWIAHQSPLLIFECKNTANKIGVPDLRILESKIRDRHAVCRIGVFVSMSGFTQPFYARLRSAQASAGVIFAITGKELADLVNRKQRLTEWLRTQGLAAAMGSRSR